jgi:hypothetical protein
VVGDVLNRVGDPGLVDSGSGREANRVRVPGHPFATHHSWVVRMERYGHSRAELHHLPRAMLRPRRSAMRPKLSRIGAPP